MIARKDAMLRLAKLEMAFLEAKIGRCAALPAEEQVAFGRCELLFAADLPEYGALLRAREQLEDYAMGLAPAPRPGAAAAGEGSPKAPATPTIH